MNFSKLLDPAFIAYQSQYLPWKYVVIGSGIGGGTVAVSLVENGENVLVIERGDHVISTHCLNLARNHINLTKPNGPTQEVDRAYERAKTPVLTVDSDPYVGGPVYNLGGRSPYWGLYSPRVDLKTLEEYFPSAVSADLIGEYYDRAWCLFTNTEYKKGGFEKIETGPKDKGEGLFDELSYTLNREGSNKDLQLSKLEWAKMGAQFKPEGNYEFPQGAFSTVDRILDTLMNDSELEQESDPKLQVLLNTKALHLEEYEADPSKPNEKKIKALVIQDRAGHQYRIRGENFILSAGTIDSAAIVLRSHLLADPSKASGITDHNIYGFKFFVPQNEGHKVCPMKMSMEGIVEDIPFLLNICINAGSFLSRKFHNKPPPNDPNMCTITYEFRAHLNPENYVKISSHTGDPIVRIKRSGEEEEGDGTERKMKESIKKTLTELNSLIRHTTEGFLKCVNKDESQVNNQPWDPAGLGCVAHEVGTLRMPGGSKQPPISPVVDENLKFLTHTNLYACDLSVLPVCAPANPSLTLAALALRLGQHLCNKE